MARLSAGFQNLKIAPPGRSSQSQSRQLTLRAEIRITLAGVPEMEDFDDLPVFVNTIVNKDRSMN